MKIYKHTYSVVVLSESEVTIQNIHVLADSIDTGEDIGLLQLESTEVVPMENLKQELLAIDNDGMFFEIGD